MMTNTIQKKKKNELESYPDFSDKSNDYIKKYIYNYIEEKFKLKKGLLKRLPIHMQEEAKHEIFIDLWNNRSNYDNKKGAFSTYAYYRGTYIVSKIVRKEFKKPAAERLSKTSDFSKELRSIDLQYFIKDVKEILSKEEVLLFKLKFEDELKVKEISKIMCISIPSIYKLLGKLRIRVRKLYNNH